MRTEKEMFDFTALYDKVGFPGLGIKDFVLIGNLTNFPEVHEVCEMVKSLFPGINFIIPEDGEYATAIGTALADKCCLKSI